MKIFYILVLILFATIQLYSQNRLTNSPSTDDEKKVRFYPNPAVSKITFSFEKGYDKNFSFQIFNFIGKKIFESQLVSPITNVDLTDYFRGVYIFQIRDQKGKVIESGKFQVAK